MTPVLIITRPAPDGARFAALVQEAVAVDVILAPLMEIVPVDADCVADEVIFTSTNGVAQAARLGLHSGRAWCVGDRTTAMAQAAGFDAVSAQGTVEDLLTMILAAGPTGNLAHVRGKEARGNLAARLRTSGVQCRDVIAYEQRAVALTQETKKRIEGAEPTIVPLFSPRTAGLLIEQVTIGTGTVILAMSPAVAKAVPCGDVHVIAAPTGEAMLAATIAQCRMLSRN